jgi:UDP-N-acetylglucosamine:LPS N-acetylglucosamine transferase
MVREKLEKLGTSYIVGECNRQHPGKTLGVMLKCLKIVLKERPGVILSTGAAAGFLMCFWGKLFGSKVIWVDSVANAEKLSMSGRMIRPFADLILSQWPDVAAKYSKVEYAGELI